MEEEIINDKEHLQLYLVRNEFHLFSGPAIYSNGLLYRPFSYAFAKIYNDIPLPKNFLLLGAGFGSALYILQKKYNTFPKSTLIDTNQIVIDWAKNYNPFLSHENVQWIKSDAYDFILKDTNTYDLIGVDIFFQLENILYVYESDFLKLLHHRTHNQSWLVFNLIAHDHSVITAFQRKLEEFFQVIDVHTDRENTYVIAKRN